MRSRAARLLLPLLAALAVLAAAGAGPASTAGSSGPFGRDGNPVIFFAADGLRQDLVESYASQRALPTMRWLLRTGVRADDGGLLTQAPPNTGAGWFSLATGAWPGVHGSTNNTFAVNGAPFANRVSTFDAGVLQAETLAQAAERGGKRVAQIEWAGGRGGAINGPTVDFRAFFSGRGVATNYVGATDDPAFTASFGLQPGDDLLQVAIDYVAANSLVGPVVDGRITGP